MKRGFPVPDAAEYHVELLNRMQRSAILVLTWSGVLLVDCAAPKHPPVEDLADRENLSSFTLHSITGTRDGDRLHAQALFSDSSSILTVELHFAVGSPTTLESGTWRWARGGELQTGSVSSRSVTFLGGQDGPPSIGGTFDLLGSNGAARYRVSFPVTQLKTGWRKLER
ncbi:MAG TPA: hypothetical protein VKT81_01485 [Bryobacteraceae bacterium]|nr:hypothetical protein [Bryobacteraceae bacterium]